MIDPQPGTAPVSRTGPRSYRTGDWYAVLGPRTALLLPPDQRARAARLWELVDEGADLEDVLDALLAGGLRSLSGFALAGIVAGGDTRVLLRGAVHAEVRSAEGVTSLDGTEAASFLDRRFARVQRVALSAGQAAGPDLLVTDGLVRAARIDSPPYVATPPAPPAPLPPPPAPPAPAVPPAPPAPAVPPAPPMSPPTDQDDYPTALDLPASPDVPSVPPPPLGGPSPVPTTPPPGAPIGWGVGADLGDDPGRDSHPRQPTAPEPAADVSGPPVARLLVSDGTVVDVDRPVLVGRAPAARRASGEEAWLVVVPSPHQEISSTHLEVRPGTGADQGTAVVTDLGSTNGTVLARPGLPPEALQPGISAPLVPGALIDLGDGVTIQVTTP